MDSCPVLGNRRRDQLGPCKHAVYPLTYTTVLYMRFSNLRLVPLKDWVNPAKLLTLRIAGCYTLMPASRLSRLWDLADHARRLPGAFVECGTYRGGSAAMLISHARDRDVWLFDSWEGCPESSARDVDRHGRKGSKGDFAAAESNVEEMLSRLRTTTARVHRVKGWFAESIPLVVEAIGPIALLHLDGDWYESTLTCLHLLYPSIVSGGLLVIDDYGDWSGCKDAVDEYFSDSSAVLTATDESQVVHTKPG